MAHPKVAPRTDLGIVLKNRAGRRCRLASQDHRDL